MREHDRSIGRTGELVRPRYMVWENVPGAFSSNFKDGFGDFGAVLEEAVRIAEPGFSLPRLPDKQRWTKSGGLVGDGWSVAWRTHDAQYWGVPQRRRRISMVVDFNGHTAGDILFERFGGAESSGVHENAYIDQFGTLKAHASGGTQQHVMARMVVRRLTPLECTRLQGYPDGWVGIGDWTDEKGRVHKEADAPKYKALGNSIALPFWRWMFERMAAYLPEGATLGSLFDGIGGFPLCWESIHGKGTAVWASEIEPFAIAVTKHHFGGNSDVR